MDGCTWAGGGGGGKELRSDVKEKMVMKVEGSGGETEPGLRNSVWSLVPCSFPGRTFLGCGVSRGEVFFW